MGLEEVEVSSSGRGARVGFDGETVEVKMFFDDDFDKLMKGFTGGVGGAGGGDRAVVREESAGLKREEMKLIPVGISDKDTDGDDAEAEHGYRGAEEALNITPLAVEDGSGPSVSGRPALLSPDYYKEEVWRIDNEASTMTEEKLQRLRATYHVPDSIVFRLPEADERVSRPQRGG